LGSVSVEADQLLMRLPLKCDELALRAAAVHSAGYENASCIRHHMPAILLCALCSGLQK